MKTQPLEYTVMEVETALFGRKVLILGDETTPEDYTAGIENLIKKEKPWYMNRMCDARDLTTIHAFEDLGFRFVELRIFRYLKIDSIHASAFSYFPYEITELNEENIPAMFDIVSSYPSDDRFSRDPQVPSGLSLRRLELYLQKSISNPRTEFVYGLVNHHTGELAGFLNGEFTTKKTVRYYYSFMAKSHNTASFAAMLESAAMDALFKRGVGRVEAITSGLNVEEINESLSALGFTVEKTMVLLRKIFEK